MDTDRNLLFGVVALKAKLIDTAQFSNVCTTASGETGKSLGDQLVERGVLTEADRAYVDREVDRTLTMHGNDLPSTLADLADSEVREKLAGTGLTMPGTTQDAADSTPVHGGHVLLSSLAPRDESRERYTRTRLHAKGGIGQVWLARDQDLRRDVALKELRPERAENQRIWQRFLQEAQITGQLEHPSIVPVYELAWRGADNNPYYTMRFVRGHTLNQAILAYHAKRRAGGATAVDLQALLNAFVAVCNALAYAHSRGVVHRDLKGQNVVLGDYGEVMVLDWGLAKLIDQPEETPAQPDGPRREYVDSDTRDMTVQGFAMGTPAYMPPEQAEGRHLDVDQRSDVYSLGAMLYEILTGEAPFAGSTTNELLHKVVCDPPRPPRSINSSAPPALQAICLKAMEKVPADRYQDAATLAADVQRVIADEPVAVYREPWQVRLARWSKRHKTAVLAAGLIACVGLAAFAVSSYLVRVERNEARAQRQQARSAVDDMYTQVAEKWLEDRLDPLQREFLQKALAYYENFTEQNADDATVRQEKGRAYERMGDILRKLGRNQEAERAYRQAIEILGKLSAQYPGNPRHRFFLASTQSRLGQALAARGQLGESEGLYRAAIQEEASIAAAQSVGPDERLDVAKTWKSLADLLRLKERSAESELDYRKAIDVLEPLVQVEPTSIAARKELAASVDGLGLLLRGIGRSSEALSSYRRAVALNEAIAAEQPLLPQPRETLSKSLSGLGTFLSSNGQLEEAERFLTRALDVDQRLAGDFPLRPEYQRDLARSHVNLGLLLKNSKRSALAEDHYRQAVALYEGLTAGHPEVLQYRLDLGRTSINLGEVLGLMGKKKESEAPYRKAIVLYEQLAKDNPQVPLYRESVEVSYRHLGELLATTGNREQAYEAYQKSFAVVEALVEEYPSKPDYRNDLAKTLTNLGNWLRFANRPDEAEASYRRAIEACEKLAAEFPTDTEYRWDLGNSLNSLAGLKRAGAEEAYHRAIEVFTKLVADAPNDPRNRQLLAVTHINLGEFQAAKGQAALAEASYNEAVTRLELLVTEDPTTVSNQAYLGYALAGLGQLQLSLGKAADARALFEQAIDHQQKALAASPSSSFARNNLLAHRKALAQVFLAFRDHSAAAAVAEQIAQEAGAGGAKVDAAGILARCVPLAQSDTQLTEADRKTKEQALADRAMALLREAIAKDAKTVDRIKASPDFEPLRSRDDFQKLMATGAKPPAQPKVD